MKRGLALAFLIACERAATPAVEPAPPSADAGVAAVDAAPTAAPVATTWRLVAGHHQMCFVRGDTTKCVSLTEENDPKLIAEVPARPLHWRLTDGVLSSVPEAMPAYEGARRFTTTENGARDAVAKQVPSLVKLVQTTTSACGITTEGQIVCWSEPFFFSSATVETPVFQNAVHPIDGAAGIKDLFLQEWLDVCALANDGTVRCSPPTQETHFCRVNGAAGPARCGINSEGVSKRVGNVVYDGPARPTDTYDPRTVVARALVPVPGVNGARAIAPYASLAYVDFSPDPGNPTAISIQKTRTGGCALDAEGVTCFDRDPCTKPKTGASPNWRTQRVGGAANITALALGDNDGYALDKDGNVLSWPRAKDECKAQAPTAHRFLSGVRDILALESHGEHHLSFVAPLVCAAMLDDTIRCWRTPKDAPVRVPL